MGFHVGQTFGDYTITAMLGAGGMGRIYKVEHRLTKRTEAMKVLTAELATEIQIKRFEREMQSLAKLDHPNIAVLHNAVHSERQLILLMEFIDGQSLESVLRAGRLPLHEAIGYTSQILFALRHAHQQGVVHRDVTPANVLITANGEVKLTDFGLSKSFGDPLLTNCNEVLGALPYMAPEQVKGSTQPDRRSDLYSVGAILYQVLTGQTPFGAERRLSTVLNGLESEPQPPTQIDPNLSPQWDEIMNRALARNPECRYQSADEFLDAITQFEQAPAAKLPPPVRIAFVPIAILTSGVIALAGSMLLNQFGHAEIAPAPSRQVHISPPDFATRLTPPVKSPPSKSVAQPVNPSTPKELAAPAAEVTQDAEPAVAERAAPDIPDVPQKKRGFWSKLNVFKKRPK
jgi:serine/threonine protein kinase